MQKMFSPHRNFVPVIIFLIIIAVLCGLLFGFFKIRPIVIAVAKSKLDYIGNKIVNAAVEKRFKNVNYSDLVIINKDANEKVAAISVDFAKLNLLKSGVMLDVAEKIESLSETDIKIPLGNFFDTELLMGIGPKVSFKIVPYGTVYVDFRDEFTAMGINQTIHEIYLDVKTTVAAIIPGMKTTSQITTSVMVAHTVIVGEVPESYTGVNEIQGKIEDYILDVIP